MIKVIFTTTRDGNMFTYPDDRDLFRNTVRAGNDTIADYIGELPLTAYQGEWPLTSTVNRLTISAAEFLSLFTATEFGIIYASVIPEIVQLRKMLEVSHDVFDISTNVLINTGIDALVTTTLLTAERAAEIRLGYPETV